MAKSTHRSRRALAAMSQLSLALLAALSAAAKGDDADWKLDIWNDPAFKRQFVATYGINAEVEPRIAPEELKVLEEVRPFMQGDLPKAEAALKKAVKPEASAILDFTLGSVQFQQGNMAEALGNYKAAVQKFPSFRRAWRNLGLIHIRDGRHDEGIAAFTKMIELGGGDAYSYGLLGFAYAAKEDYQAAEAAYRNALLLQPDNLDWRLGMTKCVFKEQKYEEAVTLLETLLATNPEKTEFWLLQAQAFLGLKEPLRAAQNLIAVEKLGKGTADSLNTLGDIYFNEGLMDLAVDAYVRAIDADKAQPIARPLRSAEMLASRGSTDAARRLAARMNEVWEKRMEPAERQKFLKLEARLSMAEGGDSAAGVMALEEIVKNDPLDGEALMMLGQHHSRDGDPERAIFYYERAASIESFEAGAKLRHAQVLVGAGRYKEAVPLLRRSQELKPRDDIARYLEQVERISRTR